MKSNTCSAESIQASHICPNCPNRRHDRGPNLIGSLTNGPVPRSDLFRRAAMADFKDSSNHERVRQALRERNEGAAS